MKHKHPYALFGNGPQPTHPIIKERLKLINTFFCVDGGADKLRAMGHNPHFILGDLDSIVDKNKYNCEVIPLEDQSKNDLEKSIFWCINQGIKELELFGFSYGRDDQHIANLLIMKNFSDKMKLKMYTDNSYIFCINQHTSFLSKANQKVSIFSFNSNTRITTTGLKYILQNSSLNSPSHGISNLATGTKFSITPSDIVMVIIDY